MGDVAHGADVEMMHPSPLMMWEDERINIDCDTCRYRNSDFPVRGMET
jgi:hypothetical protein